MTDPEDLLSDSLQTLYDYAPITHSSAGSFFTYTYAGQDATHGEQPSPSDPTTKLTITLQTPDTQPANWTLHASSIWVSSLFLADHMHDLRLARHLARASEQGAPLRVLELGAGAGLPGILLARRHDGVRVVSSDYPDAGLIKTLAENVARNGAQDRCRAVPYAWGSDPAPLFSAFAASEPHVPDGFDVVLAADTLWNSELHGIFIETLCATLRRSAHARIFLVAGLHTGRYTIQSFMRAVEDAGLVFEEAMEKESNGDGSRPWDVERAGETEKDRRRVDFEALSARAVSARAVAEQPTTTPSKSRRAGNDRAYSAPINAALTRGRLCQHRLARHHHILSIPWSVRNARVNCPSLPPQTRSSRALRVSRRARARSGRTSCSPGRGVPRTGSSRTKVNVETVSPASRRTRPSTAMAARTSAVYVPSAASRSWTQRAMRCRRSRAPCFRARTWT